MKLYKFKKVIRNPHWLIYYFLLFTRLARIIPDKMYLKLQYHCFFKKTLNLKNPQTFDEKLQWLKLYDRNPEYTKMADKYEAKKYVTRIIGEDHIIPTLGVWKKFENIDFEKLPNQFVLKCTHDSGSVTICLNKSDFDFSSAKNKLSKSLKRNSYLPGREWVYKNVKPRIIAEQYMVDESGTDLKDYKIYNFNGKAEIIQIDYNRFTEHKRNLYSPDWNFIDAQIQYSNDPNHKIDKPKQLKKMLELASALSKDIPHVRTDFYSIDDKIYFGELTFYAESGLGKFKPESLNFELGRCLELPC